MDTQEIWYLNDPTSRETFVQSRHDERRQAIGLLYSKHGLYISSGLRPDRNGSLHEVQSGGLGFDGSAGPNTPENIAKERAVGEEIRDNPKLRALFQEVVAHDVSPNQDGYHIHAAFKANLSNVLEKMKDALGERTWFDMASEKDLKKALRDVLQNYIPDIVKPIVQEEVKQLLLTERRLLAVGDKDATFPAKDINLQAILKKLER